MRHATSVFRAAIAFALALLVPPASAIEGVTRPDSIVFNHTIALADAAEVSLPLYFTRRGYYFAEVYFDRDGAQRARPGEPVHLSFSIDVLRRGELMFTRSFDEAIAPDTRVATLFRLDTDRELPLKTRLEVVIRLGSVAPELSETIESLTFQIRRKPNFRLGL